MIKTIYIISNPAWEGWFKIGIATNWKKRWQSYQTSCPFRDYKFVYAKSSIHWKKIEAALINSFPGHNEWVQADVEDIKNLLNSLILRYETIEQEEKRSDCPTSTSTENESTVIFNDDATLPGVTVHWVETGDSK